MTGCYPVRVGMGDVIAPRADGTISPSRVLWPNSPFGISADEVLIPEALKKVGYATGLVGKWHLGGPFPLLPLPHYNICVIFTACPGACSTTKTRPDTNRCRTRLRTFPGRHRPRYSAS